MTQPLNTITTVAAVVVTYNRKELLRQCLNGILKQSRQLDLIYVLDNASTDGTDQMIHELYSESVHYVRLPQNLGGAGGFHHGMKAAWEAGYDYVWIMDDDVRPEKDCLQFLLKASSQASVVTPLHVSLKGDIVGINPMKEKKMTTKENIANTSVVPEVVEVSDITFEGPLFHKSLISSVGLPRIDFFISGDDTEYGARILQLRLGKIVCATEAIMVRMLTNSGNECPPWRQYYCWRNSLHIRRRYERPLTSDLRYIAAYVRDILLRHESIAPFSVWLNAWRDSFSEPMKSRYLPTPPSK